MLKILVGLAFACVVSASSNMALAAEISTLKTTQILSQKMSLQKVKFSTQKDIYSHNGRADKSSRDSTSKAANNQQAMPFNAQVGLLLTALLCFVARSSRKTV